MDLKKLKLFNARNNIIKMCITRGYTVNPSLQRLKFQEFLHIGNDDIHIVNGITRTYEKRQLNVIVFFCGDEEPTVDDAVGSLQTSSKIVGLIPANFGLGGQATHHLILVKYYTKYLKGIDEYDNNEFIEIHNLKVISMDTLDHIYQAEYKLLPSKDEFAKQIKQKYMTTGSSFPTICIDDPVNKYYGGHINDLYEVCSQEANGTRKTFRIVIGKRMNIPANEK